MSQQAFLNSLSASLAWYTLSLVFPCTCTIKQITLSLKAKVKTEAWSDQECYYRYSPCMLDGCHGWGSQNFWKRSIKINWNCQRCICLHMAMWWTKEGGGDSNQKTFHGEVWIFTGGTQSPQLRQEGLGVFQRNCSHFARKAICQTQFLSVIMFLKRGMFMLITL